VGMTWCIQHYEGFENNQHDGDTRLT